MGAPAAQALAAVAITAPSAGPPEGVRWAPGRADPAAGAPSGSVRRRPPTPWLPGEAGGQLMLWPLERKAGQRARGSLGAESESVWVSGAAFAARDPGE